MNVQYLKASRIDQTSKIVKHLGVGFRIDLCAGVRFLCTLTYPFAMDSFGGDYMDVSAIGCDSRLTLRLSY